MYMGDVDDSDNFKEHVYVYVYLEISKNMCTCKYLDALEGATEEVSVIASQSTHRVLVGLE